MTLKTDIIAALGKLDHASDADWTADGLPDLNAVAQHVGRPVTRQQVSNASPSFARDVKDVEPGEADLPEDEAPPSEEAAEQPEEPVAETQEAPAAPEAPEPSFEASRAEPETPEDELAYLDREIHECDIQVKEINDYKAALQRRQASLSAQVEAERPCLATELKRFRDSQHAQTVAAHEQRQRIAAALGEAGGFLSSPLDRVMARKSGHGKNRPIFKGPPNAVLPTS